MLFFFFCYFIFFSFFFFFFQAEDGIRDLTVTGVQTCALPIFIAGTLRVHLALHLINVLRISGPFRSVRWHPLFASARFLEPLRNKPFAPRHSNRLTWINPPARRRAIFNDMERKCHDQVLPNHPAARGRISTFPTRGNRGYCTRPQARSADHRVTRCPTLRDPLSSDPAFGRIPGCFRKEGEEKGRRDVLEPGAAMPVRAHRLQMPPSMGSDHRPGHRTLRATPPLRPDRHGLAWRKRYAPHSHGQHCPGRHCPQPRTGDGLPLRSMSEVERRRSKARKTPEDGGNSSASR